MGKDVIHADQRLSKGPRKPFCEGQPDKEGPDEPRTVRHRHCIHVSGGHARR